MKLLHAEYVIAIAQEGSLYKASEKLLVAQPNLSRVVKELEHELGVSLFKRTHSGMILTPEGEEFVSFARSMLRQVDEIKSHFKEGGGKRTFSISVPRASYIADAFSNFVSSLGDEDVDIYYKETNSLKAVRNVLERNFHLGIIRYNDVYDLYFREMIAEKQLVYSSVARFQYVLIASKDSPLAKLNEVCLHDLDELVQIAHPDVYIPSHRLYEELQAQLTHRTARHIYVYERASQFELLHNNPMTYMWVSPVPKYMLDRMDLVQMKCVDNTAYFRDVLIYREGHALSDLQEKFIREVERSKAIYLDGDRGEG